MPDAVGVVAHLLEVSGVKVDPLTLVFDLLWLREALNIPAKVTLGLGGLLVEVFFPNME